MASAQETPEISTESPVAVDYDSQIQTLKKEIDKYNNMARQFDRKASMLRSRDFSGSRNAALIRDRCKEVANDLQKHLDALQKEHEGYLQSSKETKGE